MPLRQVPASKASSLNGLRCASSRPQRMPPAPTHSTSRARSSSSRRKRRRTGSRSARSRTSEAVRRPGARSSTWATTPRIGLVLRRERSASLTRRSGWRLCGASSSSAATASPEPKVAWMSGAKASMSGHMTMTSRGSRVGSSSNRCSTASRRTSTWRARPWQAWTSMERSFSASSGRSSRARGPRSARTSAWIRSSREASPRRDGMVVVDVLTGAEHDLQLARVPPPRGQQPVLREGGGGVVGPARDRAGRLEHGRRRRPTAPPTDAGGRGGRRGRRRGRPEQRGATPAGA